MNRYLFAGTTPEDCNATLHRLKKHFLVETSTVQQREDGWWNLEVTYQYKAKATLCPNCASMSLRKTICTICGHEV